MRIIHSLTAGLAMAATAAVLLGGCCVTNGSRNTASDSGESSKAHDMTPMEAFKQHLSDLAAKPEHSEAQIEVQHLLVGFVKADGSTTVPGKPIKMSQSQAEALTAELLARINKGEDFGQLVAEYTHDSAPGIYGMVARDTGSTPPNYYPRKGMVPAFGNVGWKLKVGEVGVAEYDPRNSPYGWHIIKRLK